MISEGTRSKVRRGPCAGCHLDRRLGGDQDPAVTLDLDQLLPEPKLAHPGEVGDCLGTSARLSPAARGDPLPVTLAFADLGALTVVDLLDRGGELFLVC